MQVDPQLTGGKLVLLHYGFLKQNKTGDPDVLQIHLLALRDCCLVVCHLSFVEDVLQ